MDGSEREDGRESTYTYLLHCKTGGLDWG